MKKLLVLTISVIALLSSCKTTELGSYADDDVYINPKEEKQKQQVAAQEQAKKEALQKQADEQAAIARAAAQKAKDDANPYYKDPSYNKDDYYDYQYASRVNRFQNPMMGASYYDPYYTNMYTYTQNPALYGTSIYSTYNYGMPSSVFTNYSNGFSMGFGSSYGYGNYGYNTMGYGNYGYGYNPYGYNSYGYNPYAYGSYYGGYGYNSGFYSGLGYSNYGYGGGYYSPYYNGYNSGQWGYVNGLDPVLMVHVVAAGEVTAQPAARRVWPYRMKEIADKNILNMLPSNKIRVNVLIMELCPTVFVNQPNRRRMVLQDE